MVISTLFFNNSFFQPRPDGENWKQLYDNILDPQLSSSVYCTWTHNREVSAKGFVLHNCSSQTSIVKLSGINISWFSDTFICFGHTHSMHHSHYYIHKLKSFAQRKTSLNVQKCLLWHSINVSTSCNSNNKSILNNNHLQWIRYIPKTSN